MAAVDVDFAAPPWLHLVSAFLAMEPSDSLIALSRVCGGGSITETVQSFIWEHCICKADWKGYAPYLKSFLKKLILEIESAGGVVLDELYEHFAVYMTSVKGDDMAKGKSKVLKQVSFLFCDEALDTPTHLSSRQLVVTLQCSLNMLEGDTGCSIWPSSFFLSEFILSCPEKFYMKSCFEVGSGVGLVGICLAHVKASKVILSDGDLSSLANLKLNLEQNKLSTTTSLLESIARSTQDQNTVQCLHLPWESADESQLQDFMPNVVFGADVIYDPLCIPHLVRVLATLLRPKKSQSPIQIHRCQGSIPNGKVNGAGETYSTDQTAILSEGYFGNSDANADRNHGFVKHKSKVINTGTTEHQCQCLASKAEPIAYIASVIRNLDTFNYFLTIADQANLTVMDITEKLKPFDLLPYMLSYQRSSVRLLTISYLCQ